MKNPSTVQFSVSYGLKLLVSYLAIAAFILAPSGLYHIEALKGAAQSAQSLKKQIIAQNTQTPAAENQIGNPVSLTLTRQQLSLPLMAGTFNSTLQTWDVANNTVEWITTSTQLVNNKPDKPIILYGHATSQVLASSLTPVKNDTLTIRYEHGLVLLYEYVNDETVLPSDTSVLTITDPTYLALITCSGINNQYRHVGNYKFVGVIK